MSTPIQPQGEERSVVSILSGLWENTERLLRQELALGLSEIDRRSEQAALRLKRAAIGGAVLMSGGLALVAALILLLAQYIAPWLAAAMVGVVVTGIGYAMLKSADPTPDVARAHLPNPPIERRIQPERGTS